MKFIRSVLLTFFLPAIGVASVIRDEVLVSRVLKDASDSTVGQWSSLTPDLDFVRVLSDPKFDKVTSQILGRTLKTEEPGVNLDTCAFLPSTNIYYPEYAITWRFLGISIDCNYQGKNRILAEGGNNLCSRVLLYAVYVDVNHDENLGLDQYSFYNRATNSWSVCGGNANSGNRCVPMDCHLPNSENFKLLGLYKNYDMNTWMEQLFKHEGVCVWTNDEYTAAQNTRDMINANQCGQIGYDSAGVMLYGGVHPIDGGNIGVSLFNDAYCSDVYSGPTTIESICGSQCSSYQNNKKRDLGGNNKGACAYYCYAGAFNDAMNVWKQCQPCTAYTPGYYGSYECSDAAGYNNCLQCMKFRAKANSVPADISDILNADRQGGITSIDICGTTYGKGGYGYEGGVPSFNAALNIQKNNLQLMSQYENKPMDHSKPYFFVSIFSLVTACGFFFYEKFVSKSIVTSDASFSRNKSGAMI